MTLKKRLSALISTIIAEAEKNESFRTNVERALGINASTGVPQSRAEETIKQRKWRRTPAVLDPVELVRQGENELRAKLSVLTLDQLLDIVAQYGMDPGKLVMKWKNLQRIINHIVELALTRSTKGDAFRSD